MDDKAFITSIRDQCNAHLSGSGGGTVPPPTFPTGNVPAINVKPAGTIGDLGIGNGQPIEKVVQPYEVIAVGITFRADAYSRTINWAGKPGDIFDYTSWAIFDSAGNRVMGQDNFQPAGTLGMKIEDATLKPFQDGSYTLAIAIDGPAGNLYVQFNQAYPA